MSNIISITASGPGFSNAFQIADVVHDWTIYLVDTTNNGGIGLGVILPANADVGDIVEFHGGPFSIYPDAGSTFNGSSQPNAGDTTTTGYLIRKTTSTTWQTMANR